MPGLLFNHRPATWQILQLRCYSGIAPVLYLARPTGLLLMLSQFKQPRRVVITGIGCVTPIGIGRQAFWEALTKGESGVRRIQSFDVSNSPVKIAAEVRGFDWEAELSPKDRKHVPRTVPLALAASREALKDANFFPNDISLDERRGVGVILGTGGGGLAFTERQYEHWYAGVANKA